MTPEKWIREIISDRGVSQMHLRRRTGISYLAINNALTGRRRFTVPEFLAICLALDVDPLSYLDTAKGGESSAGA